MRLGRSRTRSRPWACATRRTSRPCWALRASRAARALSRSCSPISIDASSVSSEPTANRWIESCNKGNLIMSKSASFLRKLTLEGLSIAPSQSFGAVRLVPLIRRNVREDLRLAKRSYDERAAVVSLEGGLLDRGPAYISYIPHGLVVSWTP